MTKTPLPQLEHLKHRADLLRQLRGFFDSRGFLEVQPPCLSADCIVDAYIDPIQISADQLHVSVDLPSQFYLQTSPESALKRMLVAGAPSIYSIGPVFRAGERGRRHNVEFTMLEWYDVGASMNDEIGLLCDLACEIFQSSRCDVVNYRDLFRDQLGFDPIESPIGKLESLVGEIDPALISADRDSLLDVLLTERIEPQLGLQRPVIVKNYPITQAALAQYSHEDRDCAARFELFYQGIELANGYDELRDPEVLAERQATQNRKRFALGREPIRTESALANAMQIGLPPCAGVALGVDRLLMVRTSSQSIDRVLPFPVEIA